ncbi:granzyme-like protein 1 [Simochromis diagramma]|uniref:granzyme-like protein 1 n=1 Tax=Simochromis diagramma TaxID=43689 RepID=UPI001A7E7116|nr:granzyme-like protein 1 [Simochromis diagramma]
MHALQKCLLVTALTCLIQNALGSEIINGKKVDEKFMQYMASVQNNKIHTCGGFLVSEDFVMTAAHCAVKKLKSLSVVLGTHDLKKENKKMRYGVKMMCRHPAFKEVANGNDIMLLKLSKKVSLGNKKAIKLIPLPIRKLNLKEKKICSVAGWGAIKTSGNSVNELQVLDVPIINKDECQKVWGQIPKNVICAGGYKAKSGICQGDSGGPLVCNESAVGIVSFNNDNGCKCDYPDVPNVYTDISQFLPWITDILKKKKCKG